MTSCRPRFRSFSSPLSAATQPRTTAFPPLHSFLLLLLLLHHHLPLVAAQSQYYRIDSIGNLSSSLAILIVGVLVCSLFAGLIYLYVHWCTTSLLSRNDRGRTSILPIAILGNRASCSSSIGIDEPAIQKLPVIIFSEEAEKSKAGIGLTECAVCLNEFHDGVILRSLPRCKHAFHYECIQRWLVSHSTCPVCRADVLAETKEIAAGNGMDYRVTASEESGSVVVEIVGCEPSGNSLCVEGVGGGNYDGKPRACRSSSTGCSLNQLGEKSERLTVTGLQDEPPMMDVGAEMRRAASFPRLSSFKCGHR